MVNSHYYQPLIVFSLMYYYEIKREVHSSVERPMATVTRLSGMVILETSLSIRDSGTWT